MHFCGLFRNNEPVTFICDDDKLIAWLRNQEICAINAKNLSSAPRNAIIVHSNSAYLDKINEIVVHSNDSCVLSLNQLAFDHQFESLRYSCEKLLEINFYSVFAYQSEQLAKLENSANPLLLRNGKTDLKCHFTDNVHFAYPKQLFITPGVPRNVNEYLELHFENLNDSINSCFELEGQLSVSSILFAIAPSRLKTFDIQKQLKARQLFNRVVQSDNVMLTISANKVTSFIINDIEYRDELYLLAGNKKGLELTEFAFGLNKGIKKNIDWSLNSQLNEGVEGIHVGIGDGFSGIHLDFICTEMVL